MDIAHLLNQDDSFLRELVATGKTAQNILEDREAKAFEAALAKEKARLQIEYDSQIEAIALLVSLSEGRNNFVKTKIDRIRSHMLVRLGLIASEMDNISYTVRMRNTAVTIIDAHI